MLANPLKSWCLGRELNPHSHLGPRDFKSLASTYSATQAGLIKSDFSRNIENCQEYSLDHNS